MGATLLLPISVISNEVLLLYPNTYYVQWLNGMLIQGLWNLIFLFANISLFILLPFAYLFIESEGFSGHKKVCIIISYTYHMIGLKIWMLKNACCYAGPTCEISRSCSSFSSSWIQCLGHRIHPRSISESGEICLWRISVAQLCCAVTLYLFLHFVFGSTFTAG